MRKAKITVKSLTCDGERYTRGQEVLSPGPRLTAYADGALHWNFGVCARWVDDEAPLPVDETKAKLESMMALRKARKKAKAELPAPEAPPAPEQAPEAAPEPESDPAPEPEPVPAAAPEPVPAPAEPEPAAEPEPLYEMTLGSGDAWKPWTPSVEHELSSPSPEAPAEAPEAPDEPQDAPAEAEVSVEDIPAEVAAAEALGAELSAALSGDEPATSDEIGY